SPVAAIEAMVSIVAHYKEFARRQCQRIAGGKMRFIGLWVVHGLIEIRLLLPHEILRVRFHEPYRAVVYGDRIAADRDNTLDQRIILGAPSTGRIIHVRFRWSPEDDNVAAPRLLEPI